MRQEQDREDLMAEATALVERAELNVPPWAEPITIGFRRDGSSTFYFGPEEVYQFNSRQQLRRAFHEGHLFKAVEGKLIQLRRERAPTTVHLLSRDLTREETADRLLRVRAVLMQLVAACRAGQATLVAQIPADADVVQRVLSISDALIKAEIADKPNAL
jgi:hypothetical protein